MTRIFARGEQHASGSWFRLWIVGDHLGPGLQWTRSMESRLWSERKKRMVTFRGWRYKYLEMRRLV